MEKIHTTLYIFMDHTVVHPGQETKLLLGNILLLLGLSGLLLFSLLTIMIYVYPSYIHPIFSVLCFKFSNHGIYFLLIYEVVCGERFDLVYCNIL